MVQIDAVHVKTLADLLDLAFITGQLPIEDFDVFLTHTGIFYHISEAPSPEAENQGVFWNRMAERRIAPLTTIMAGAISVAWYRPILSESIPIMGGEIASPNAWMKKMLTAIAVARIEAGTHPRMTAFRGPVFRKRKNSAMKTAGRKTPGEREAKATTATGAPKNMHTPDTQR
jgi:hypothetical protein